MDQELADFERLAQSRADDLLFLEAWEGARRRAGWRYRDRSAEEWVQRLKVKTGRERATAVIQALGLRVLPALVRALDEQDLATRCVLLEVLGSLRGRAVAATSRVSALFDAEDRPRVRAAAARCLGAIGHPGAEPRLIRGCEERDWEIRQACVQALGLLKEPSPKALSALEAAARDPDEDVRESADEALDAHRRAPRDRLALEVDGRELAVSLQAPADEDPAVMAALRRAFAELAAAPDSEAAALSLAFARRDPEAFIAEARELALDQRTRCLGGLAEVELDLWLDTVVASLYHEDEASRGRALASFEAIASTERRAAIEARLRARIEADREDLASRQLQVLLGVEHEQRLAELRERLVDAVPSERESCYILLRNLAARYPPARALALDLVRRPFALHPTLYDPTQAENEDPEIARFLADTLMKMQRGIELRMELERRCEIIAAAAVPGERAWVEALAHVITEGQHDAVRRGLEAETLTRTVAALGPIEDHLIKLLRGRLGEPSVLRRLQVIEAMITLDERREDLANALSEILAAPEHRDHRSRVLESLEALEIKGRPALPAISEQIRSAEDTEESRLIYAAVAAYARIGGRRAQTALDLLALLEGCNGSETFKRRYLIEAIGLLGRAGRKALPALRRFEEALPEVGDGEGLRDSLERARYRLEDAR